MPKVNDDNTEVTNTDLDQIDAYLEKKKQNPSKETLSKRSSKRALIESKKLNPEQVAGLEWEAWHQRTMGKSVQWIALQMKTSVNQVNLWLQHAMAQVKAKTSELIELDKELELQRTEILLEKYLPLAMVDEVVVQKIRNGDPISVSDLDAPRKNAYLVIQLIKLRNEIRGTVQEQVLDSNVDVMGWLHTQKEFISKAVKDAPRDVLTLEVENPIDEAATTNNDAT